MRILVIHAWTRGNLGDVMQTVSLLKALRDLNPKCLDLAGYPFPASPQAGEMLLAADRFLSDSVRWELKFVPSGLLNDAGRIVGALGRARLFNAYDVVLSAPGPFLASHDHRLNSALTDMAIAKRLGKKLILSSHSIGPLPGYALRYFDAIDLCVAREPSTLKYLASHNINSVPSADYAFLYPFSEALGQQGDTDFKPPYQVAFLRANNLDLSSVHIEGGQLKDNHQVIAELGDIPMLLTTSDAAKDDRALTQLSKRLNVRYVKCRSVADMIRLIANATSVISDRYHPAVCSIALGRQLTLLKNKENNKMEGLRSLHAQQSLKETQKLAQDGLAAIQAHLLSLA